MEIELISPDNINSSQITGFVLEASLDLQFLLMNHTMWVFPLPVSFCESGKAGVQV